MSSTTSERERNRIADIHEFGLDVEHFYVYVQGVADDPMDDYPEPGVEFRMANMLIRNLDILQGLDPDGKKAIVISMKTCGGDWVEGMAMYDAIVAVPNPVTIISYSHARSMSSILLQAANKRVLMPNSYFMYHLGTDGFEGTTKQLMSYAAFVPTSIKQMLQVYEDCLKRTPHGCYSRWSRKRINEMLVKKMNQKEEVYLTAQEAVRQGFADEIFTGWDVVTTYTDQQMERK